MSKKQRNSNRGNSKDAAVVVVAVVSLETQQSNANLQLKPEATCMLGSTVRLFGWIGFLFIISIRHRQQDQSTIKARSGCHKGADLA